MNMYVSGKKDMGPYEQSSYIDTANELGEMWETGDEQQQEQSIELFCILMDAIDSFYSYINMRKI